MIFCSSGPDESSALIGDVQRPAHEPLFFVKESGPDFIGERVDRLRTKIRYVFSLLGAIVAPIGKLKARSFARNCAQLALDHVIRDEAEAEAIFQVKNRVADIIGGLHEKRERMALPSGRVSDQLHLLCDLSKELRFGLKKNRVSCRTHRPHPGGDRPDADIW